MKLLILGIDGLGYDSLRGLGLSRLASLLEKGQCVNPQSDNIVSRGWPEIYSGVSSYESGAFFQVPIMREGKILATQKTGADVVASHIGEDILLWSRLKSMGYRVGLFGLPTVTTAQKGCVFSFPATGAGQFKNSTESVGVFPDTLARLANYSLPNHGLRIGHGAYLPKSVRDIEAWLRDHLSQNFYTLRQTMRRMDVDALIFGSRFVTLFYKFHHILSTELSDYEDIQLKNVLLEAAQDFDYELTKFIEECSPKDIFVVSDHGLSQLKYHVNINELLRIQKLIDYPSVFKTAPRMLARKLRDQLRGFNNHYFPTFDLESSKAFSIGYTDVIYINDARFTGPSMTDIQRYSLAHKLSEQLSLYVQEQNLSQFIEFKPLHNSGWTAPLSAGFNKIALPDIRCVLAQGCVNLERTNGRIIEENRPYFAKEMFEKGFFAEHSGCKSNDTIAAYIGPNKEKFAPKHLTDIYDEILRVAEGV
jgi:hypothetical protein